MTVFARVVVIPSLWIVQAFLTKSASGLRVVPDKAARVLGVDLE
jgi:hypothetical protein